MFAKGNHTMMGSTEDPENGSAVAAAVFGAVGVYGVSSSLYLMTGISWDRVSFGHVWIGLLIVSLLQVFLLFCASQAFLNHRQSRQGEIALR